MKQEIIGMRTRNSKTFDNGNGTRTLHVVKHGLHYMHNGHYEDIDTTIDKNGDMTKAGYSFSFIGNLITFSKGSDWIEFEVDKLQWSCEHGGQALVSLFKKDVVPIVNGNEVRWDNAFGQGIHLLYRCSPDGIYKQVILDDYIEPPAHLIDDPELLLEVVLKYRKSNINVKVNKQPEDFNTYRYLRDEKVVFGDDKFELRVPVYWDSGVGGTGIGHRIITTNTIRTGVTHLWLIKAIYPVYIDTDVNEQVGASTDDCQEFTDTSVALTGTNDYFGEGDVYGGGYEDIGLRWTTVAVPKDSNIISAVLSLFKTNSIGSPVAAIWGIDEDNTLTWATDNRPSQRVKTTANVSADKADWGNFGADGDDVWITRDISSIISEITSRASWASDNALGIVIITDHVDLQSIYLRMWDYAGNAHGAKLDITYGAAAGWGAKINGITPGKVNGIAVADISKIIGV